MTKIIAIVGPTAVGKTDLSVKMAQQLNGEIISGDSMQVYRHLDIGTAKIRPEEMQGIKHHMIDIRDVNERFSAADFQHLATEDITTIVKHHKIPIIVGGTGFYLQALANNLTLGADQFDEQSLAIRQHWQSFERDQGQHALWQQLAQRDPETARKLDERNSRRVIRALEVIEKTGHAFSDQKMQSSNLEVLFVGLTTDRQQLYQRINERVDVMISTGLLDEAKWLYGQGGRRFQSGNGIGYHELFDYFEQRCDLPTAIDQIKKDSRHYAKRQLTWFRNKMDVTWFDLVTGVNSVSEINRFVADWL